MGEGQDRVWVEVDEGVTKKYAWNFRGLKVMVKFDMLGI